MWSVATANANMTSLRGITDQMSEVETGKLWYHPNLDVFSESLVFFVRGGAEVAGKRRRLSAPIRKTFLCLRS